MSAIIQSCIHSLRSQRHLLYIGQLLAALIAVRFFYAMQGVPVGDNVPGAFRYWVVFVWLNALCLVFLFCFANAFPTRGFKLTRLVLVPLLAVDLLLRIVKLTSLRTFGVGFGPEFFFHFEWESLRIAAQWFSSAFIFTLIILLGYSVLLWKNWSKFSFSRREAVFLLIASGLLLSISPLLIKNPQNHLGLYSFSLGALNYSRAVGPYKHVVFTREEVRLVETNGLSADVQMALPRMQEKPNVIFIFLESMQADLTSLGNPAFAAATPNLDRFARENTWLVNYYSSGNATIQGMMSGLCGSIPLIDFNFAANISKTKCLPEILKEQGYSTAFAMGGDHRFGSKGHFLRSHGFQSVIGREEFMRKQPDYFNIRNPWGLHDTDLAREVLHLIESQAIQEPFLLGMLTVNTHAPGFSAPDCTAISENQLVNGIHCTDYAIGILLDGLKKRGLLERTIVVITADHHYHFSGIHDPRYIELLNKQPTESGRHLIYGAIHYPKERPKEVTSFHFTADLPAMVLEGLGYKVEHFRAGFSQSRAFGRTRLVTNDYEIDLQGRYTSFSQLCDAEDLKNARISSERPWNDCARKKALYIHNWTLMYGKPN